MKILGVDPGVHGGLAIVAVDNGAAPQLVDAIDIPVAGAGAKQRVDVLALRASLATHRPHHALIERAQAMPKQGASSGFKYGRAVRAIEGVIACCEIPLQLSSRRCGRNSTGSVAATRRPIASARCNLFLIGALAARADESSRTRRRRADCAGRGTAMKQGQREDR